MSDGKALKFQFVLDEQSFSRVKRALGELTTEAQKFAKAMQSAGGGGGGLFSGANVGRPPSSTQTQGRGGGSILGGGNLQGAILKDVDSFKALARTGTDSMKMMQDATNRALNNQIRDVEKLDKQINLLKERYGGLKTEAQKANASMAMANLSQQRASAGEGLQKLHDLNYGMQYGEKYGPVRPPGMGAAKGFFANAWSTASNAGLTGDLTGGQGFGGMAKGGMEALMGPSMAGMIARSVGIAVAGATKIISTSIAADKMGIGLEAARGQAVMPAIKRLQSGDVSDILAMNSLRDKSQEERTELLRSVYGKDADLSRFGSGLLSTVKGDLTGSGLTTAARETMTFEEQQNLVNNIKSTGNFQLGIGRGFDYLASSRGDRSAASRLMGRGFYLQRDATGQLPPGDPKLKDTFSKWEQGLHKEGYSAGEATGAYGSALSMGGRQYADKYSRTLMGAAGAGYGEFGGMHASAARSGNVERALMALGGKIDAGAGIALGQAVLGSGWNARGFTGGEGVMGAAQAGMGFTGEVTDFNLVQKMQAGLGLGSSITSGSIDQYQAGRNLLTAIQNNPGGGVYAQDHLASMTMNEMLDGAGGSLSNTAKNLGLTQDMVKAQLGGTMGSFLERYEDTGNNAMDSAVERYRSSGKGLQDYLKGASKADRTALGDAYGVVSGEGGEGGEAAMDLLYGAGSKAKKGKAPYGKQDDISAIEAEQDVEEMKKNAAALAGNFGSLVTAIGGGPEGRGGVIKTMESFAQMATSVNQLSAAMARLAGLTIAASEKMEGSGTVDRVKKALEPGGNTSEFTNEWQ